MPQTRAHSVSAERGVILRLYLGVGNFNQAKGLHSDKNQKMQTGIEVGTDCFGIKNKPHQGNLSNVEQRRVGHMF